MNKEVLERIKALEISCPECEGGFDDEHYQCSTCGCEGGNGRINVVQYLDIDLESGNTCGWCHGKQNLIWACPVCDIL